MISDETIKAWRDEATESGSIPMSVSGHRIAALADALLAERARYDADAERRAAEQAVVEAADAWERDPFDQNAEGAWGNLAAAVRRLREVTGQ